jgi:hypothetical protein
VDATKKKKKKKKRRVFCFVFFAWELGWSRGRDAARSFFSVKM